MLGCGQDFETAKPPARAARYLRGHHGAWARRRVGHVCAYNLEQVLEGVDVSTYTHNSLRRPSHARRQHDQPTHRIRFSHPLIPVRWDPVTLACDAFRNVMHQSDVGHLYVV
jgi:hypothetical protein